MGSLLSHTSGLKAVAVTLHGTVGWALNGGGLTVDQSLSVVVGLVWAVLESVGVDVLGVDLGHTGSLEAVAVTFDGSVGWAFDSGGLAIDEGLSIIVGLIWAVLERVGVDVLALELGHSGGFEAVAVALDGTISWALDGGGLSVNKSLSIIICLIWAVLK